MSEKRLHELNEPHEVADWTLQLIGGAWMACYAEQGSDGRNARAQWVGRQLLVLGRAIRALAVVATNHPQEFAAALGKPIEIELAEALRCESKTQHFGLELQCQQQRHETGDHTYQSVRWRGGEQ